MQDIQSECAWLLVGNDKPNTPVDQCTTTNKNELTGCGRKWGSKKNFIETLTEIIPKTEIGLSLAGACPLDSRQRYLQSCV